MEELIQKYEKLVKDGLTAKRNHVIYRALEMSAVETFNCFYKLSYPLSI